MEQKEFVVSGDATLEIVTEDEWDGAEAAASIFEWAGFDAPDPNPAMARRGFLIYDEEEPLLRGSYKLPFASVRDGELVAVTAGLVAASRFLERTDAPVTVLEQGRAILDGYAERMESTEESGLAKAMGPIAIPAADDGDGAVNGDGAGVAADHLPDRTNVLTTDGSQPDRTNVLTDDIDSLSDRTNVLTGGEDDIGERLARLTKLVGELMDRMEKSEADSVAKEADGVIDKADNVIKEDDGDSLSDRTNVLTTDSSLSDRTNVLCPCGAQECGAQECGPEESGPEVEKCEECGSEEPGWLKKMLQRIFSAVTTPAVDRTNVLTEDACVVVSTAVEVEPAGDGVENAEKLPGDGSLLKGGSFVVVKKAGGGGIWFGIPTNNFEDRDLDIIEEAAHKEFSEFLDNNPDMAPELWIYHTPGTARKSRANWWGYSDGFMCYSGDLTADEVEQYKGDTGPVGMSHAFFVLERKGRYIKKYRSFEVSDLPLEDAANPYTIFSMEEIKKMAFTGKQREHLVHRLGEETVSALEADLKKTGESLRNLGIASKSLGPAVDDSESMPNTAVEAETGEVEVEQVTETEEVSQEEEVSKGGDAVAMALSIAKLLDLEGLQKVIVDMSTATRELGERVVELSQRVEKVDEKATKASRAQDEAIAEAITAPVFSWGTMRAVGKEASRVTDNEPLAEVVESIEKGRSPSEKWISGFHFRT